MKLFLLFVVLVIDFNCGLGEELALKAFQQGNDQFTGKFLNEVVTKNSGKNVIVSAYSVLFPLAQLSLAAVGDSRTEILSTIGLPDNIEKTKEAFKAASGSLDNVKGVTLKTASRLYVTENGQLNPSFAKDSKDVFKSGVEKVDFSKNKATAKNINDWVESKTNNRIKDLVSADSLTPDTRVVLVNAIYFKGLWETAFKKEATKERDFHVTKQKTQKVPMMYARSDFLYGESDALGAKLLEIPYKGKEASLLVVLPNEIDGVDALVKKIQDPQVLNEAIAKMHTHEVIVNLPKFKIETTTDLKEVLQKMGIKKIFGADAKLKNLLDGENNLQVDSAIQKAFIEVNEEGTEAAAANEFGISLLSATVNLAPTKSFNANHPFVFMVRAKKDALFTGIIRE